MTLVQPKEKPDRSGNRRALILAAYHRIASDGFEGLRTRDIAADVGINISTLHYYFPGKESLIRAVVHHTYAILGSTYPKSGTPPEQFLGHLEGLRHLLKTNRQVCAVSSEIALRAARDEAIAATLQQADHTWFVMLRGLISHGVTEGWLPANLDPDNTTAAVIATIRGLSMQANIMPEARIDQTIDQLEQWLGLPVLHLQDPNGESGTA